MPPRRHCACETSGARPRTPGGTPPRPNRPREGRGIAHQDVEPADGARRFADEAIECGPVAHVECSAMGVGARSLQGVHRRRSSPPHRARRVRSRSLPPRDRMRWRGRPLRSAPSPVTSLPLRNRSISHHHDLRGVPVLGLRILRVHGLQSLAHDAADHRVADRVAVGGDHVPWRVRRGAAVQRRFVGRRVSRPTACGPRGRRDRNFQRFSGTAIRSRIAPPVPTSRCSA